MEKILGIDLGTNSIGLSVRNTDNSVSNLEDQLDYFSSIIFQSGVGNGKSGEFSFAGQRTEFRTARNRYKSHRYKLWRTLEVLILHGFCPLTIEELNKWRYYDKQKGLKRQYPIGVAKFEQWIRLDFNGDGVADYSSPFQLRAELMSIKIDLNDEVDRFRLGRALYHIAQHRGFKSSKGETLKDIYEEENKSKGNVNDIDMIDEFKKSELKKSGNIVEYMKTYNLPSVGCAFAHLEKAGIRIRGSQYQAVRLQNKQEIEKIFDFQGMLKHEAFGDFCTQILSEKKGEGSIFYKRPLRSQKGNIGKCTLEPNKNRCPVSHPKFEIFRAWSFINTIQYRKSTEEEFQLLTLKEKQQLFKEKFMRTKAYFDFKEIREWIEKNIIDATCIGQLQYSKDKNKKSINYADKTTVYTCPISARLKNLLGEDWETWKIEQVERINNKGEKYYTSYDAFDLWHICFSFEDPIYVDRFAKDSLHFDDNQAKQLASMAGCMQQGYSMLSLKAIHNINRFLQKGFIYSDAVILAKLPDIFKEKWDENADYIISSLNEIMEANRHQKLVFNLANSLIANYKSLDREDQFAYHNYKYTLQTDDICNIEKVVIDNIGRTKWQNNYSDNERRNILNEVAKLYQNFFCSEERKYYTLPKVADALADFLKNQFDYLTAKELKKIYHPSMIDIYAPAKEQNVDGRWIKLLGSPVIGALRNPMAMRVLHTLRRQINGLIKEDIIYGEDTRVVVEMARELNDANMRWAIETYQRKREAENKEIVNALKEYYPNREVSDADKEKARFSLEQSELTTTGSKDRKGQAVKNDSFTNKADITKIKLWKEQGFRCVYTGKIISLSDLFDDNKVDIEHTIPRSISFDNSQANLTVCDAHFNRNEKKNRMPSQLPNHADILQNIQPWIEKVEHLKDNVEFWKKKSKFAQDKSRKDYCIRQHHLWKMELEYWQKKVNTFTMTEFTEGFRNSQLVDTRIISKYAYHYLRTVFNKVEVQNGRYTSDFRKMLGIQRVDERKDRDKHSHHAIDATVLTLIPTSAKRDEMLKLFYEKEEKKRLGVSYEKEERLLSSKIRNCNIGSVKGLREFIENNIFVNHITTDRTLKPAKRKAKRRGKDVMVKDKFGNVRPMWLNGDSIRGRLHKDSFFGAAKLPKMENGKPVSADREFVYEKDEKGKDSLTMVMRFSIDSFKEEKDLAKIIDPNVKRSIRMAIEKRKKENLSFAQALKQPIYLLDSNDCEIKSDKNGRPILPIRHVRCRVPSGRGGYFTKDKAIEVKEQTYKSSKDYKNLYYAQNDGNYLCLLYENKNNEKIEREFRFVNYFEVAKLKIKDSKDLYKERYFQTIKKSESILTLKAIIKNGTRVLMWKKSPDEISDLTKSELSKRLFVVYKFNTTGSNLIYIRNHISIYDKDEKEIKLVASKFNCLIEEIDFKISENGQIIFLHD